MLPPLRDVRNRPEVGNSLRNKLVRLMTHIDTDVKHCAAEFLFVLCKESGELQGPGARGQERVWAGRPCSREELVPSLPLRSKQRWHFWVSAAGGAGGRHRAVSPLIPAVSRFVKYTGYGNAAGLLAARGLMAGGREEGEYSEDEDTDTEEYKEAKPK